MLKFVLKFLLKLRLKFVLKFLSKLRLKRQSAELWALEGLKVATNAPA